MGGLEEGEGRNRGAGGGLFFLLFFWVDFSALEGEEVAATCHYDDACEGTLGQVSLDDRCRSVVRPGWEARW